MTVSLYNRFQSNSPILLSGQNHIVAILGANALVTLDDIKDAEKEISEADVLVCSFEVPLETTMEALKINKTHGGKTN